jgi:hypothetical protein
MLSPRFMSNDHAAVARTERGRVRRQAPPRQNSVDKDTDPSADNAEPILALCFHLVRSLPSLAILDAHADPREPARRNTLESDDGRGRQPDRTTSQRRQRICLEPPSACVAHSVLLSLLSRCWSTCAIVKTASFGQACHGAALRTFRGKPSAWKVLIRYIPGRVTPGIALTTISARPVE